MKKGLLSGNAQVTASFGSYINDGVHKFPQFCLVRCRFSGQNGTKRDKGLKIGTVPQKKGRTVSLD